MLQQDWLFNLLIHSELNATPRAELYPLERQVPLLPSNRSSSNRDVVHEEKPSRDYNKQDQAEGRSS